MKKICFIPPMQERTERKIKNQTRRLIVSRTGFFQVCSKNGIVTNIWQTDADEWTGENLIPVKPRYNVGEIVAIAQAYKDILDTLPEPYRRKSDGWISTEISESIGFRNKLYVKPILMPLQIKILDIRAERLQDISDEDCIREGICQTDSIAEDHFEPVYENGYNSTNKKNATLSIQYDTPREAYSALIDAINGNGTWDNNPWVWVYDYELIDRKEADE